MVEDDDLGRKVRHATGRIFLLFGGDVATLDVLDRYVLDVEAHVVPGGGLGQGLVVHFTWRGVRKWNREHEDPDQTIVLH